MQGGLDRLGRSYWIRSVFTFQSSTVAPQEGNHFWGAGERGFTPTLDAEVWVNWFVYMEDEELAHFS
jgi:hypothetical protein